MNNNIIELKIKKKVHKEVPLEKLVDQLPLIIFTKSHYDYLFYNKHIGLLSYEFHGGIKY